MKIKGFEPLIWPPGGKGSPEKKSCCVFRNGGVMGWKRSLRASINYHYCMRKKGTRRNFLDGVSSTAAVEEMTPGRKSR